MGVYGHGHCKGALLGENRALDDQKVYERQCDLPGPTKRAGPEAGDVDKGQEQMPMAVLIPCYDLRSNMLAEDSWSPELCRNNMELKVWGLREPLFLHLPLGKALRPCVVVPALQGSINPEAWSQAAVEPGVGEGPDLRLAVLSKAGVHMVGHSGALGLGWSSEGLSNTPWAYGVGPMLLGVAYTWCLVCPCLQ